MTNFDPLTWPTSAAIPFGAYGATATPATDYRCDTGGCPQVTYTGDTVTIVETANPEQVVVTSAEKWDAYLDTVRAQERAAIVAWLRIDAKRFDPNGQVAAIANRIERGDDLAAGDE